MMNSKQSREWRAAVQKILVILSMLALRDSLRYRLRDKQRDKKLDAERRMMLRALDHATVGKAFTTIRDQMKRLDELESK
jgi:hypothetical protein